MRWRHNLQENVQCGDGKGAACRRRKQCEKMQPSGSDGGIEKRWKMDKNGQTEQKQSSKWTNRLGNNTADIDRIKWNNNDKRSTNTHTHTPYIYKCIHRTAYIPRTTHTIKHDYTNTTCSFTE